MTEPKTRAKKRATAETEPSTPSASGSKKARNRTPEQKAAAAEAQRTNEANRAANLRKTQKEQQADAQKADLVHVKLKKKKKKASHAPTPASTNTSEEIEPATPITARDLKGELGSESQASPEVSEVAEQTIDLKEAPTVADVPMEEAPDTQSPIPVVESTTPPASTAFGKNTVESLEKDARARALANERATYGRGKYEAAFEERKAEREIDQWRQDQDDE